MYCLRARTTNVGAIAVCRGEKNQLARPLIPSPRPALGLVAPRFFSFCGFLSNQDTSRETPMKTPEIEAVTMEITIITIAETIM